MYVQKMRKAPKKTGLLERCLCLVHWRASSFLNLADGLQRLIAAELRGDARLMPSDVGAGRTLPFVGLSDQKMNGSGFCCS
jgi:hypothetical protein